MSALYQPQPGSKAAAAIAFIEKKGHVRSRELAEAIGTEPKQLTALLEAAVKHGAIVTCDITIPGEQPQKEYRIGGGMAAPAWRDLSVTAAAQAARAVAAQPAAAAEHKPRRNERPVAPPRAEGLPVTAPRLDPISRRLPAGKLVTGDDAVALLREKYVAKKGQPKTKKAQEKVQPKTAKVPRKVQPKTAKPATPALPSADDFRCGVFDNGQLVMVGEFRYMHNEDSDSATADYVTLSVAQTQALRAYLRRIDANGGAA